VSPDKFLYYSFILIPCFYIIYFAIYKPFIYIVIFLVYKALVESTLDLFSFESGIDLAGLRIYPDDFFLMAALIGIFVISDKGTYQSTDAVRSFRRLIHSQVLLVTVALFVWIFTYGIQTGVNAWRWALMPIFFMLYIIRKFNQLSMDHLQTFLVLPGVLLACVTVFRFLTNGVGSFDAVDLITGETQRATTSSGAFTIWISILGIYYFSTRLGIIQIISLIALFLVILLLQHRSVWTSVIAGISVIVVYQAQFENFSRITKYLFFTLISSLLVLIVRNDSVLIGASSSTGTFDWRVKRWKSSMTTSRSLIEWILGSVAGPTPVTNRNDYKIFAHNAYIHQIEYFGVLGLLLIFAIFIVLWSIHKSNSKIGVAIRSMVFSSLFYGVSYGITVTTFSVLTLMAIYSDQEAKPVQ